MCYFQKYPPTPKSGSWKWTPPSTRKSLQKYTFQHSDWLGARVPMALHAVDFVLCTLYIVLLKADQWLQGWNMRVCIPCHSTGKCFSHLDILNRPAHSSIINLLLTYYSVITETFSCIMSSEEFSKYHLKPRESRSPREDWLQGQRKSKVMEAFTYSDLTCVHVLFFCSILSSGEPNP